MWISHCGHEDGMYQLTQPESRVFQSKAKAEGMSASESEYVLNWELRLLGNTKQKGQERGKANWGESKLMPLVEMIPLFHS